MAFHSNNLKISSNSNGDLSLPDDLLLDCLSRVPSASLPSVSHVCRHWAELLLCSTFLHLRRVRGHLVDTAYVVSITNSILFAASFNFWNIDSWKLAMYQSNVSFFLSLFYGLLPHAQLSAVGPRIYLIGRNAMFLYDTWSGIVTERSAMNFSRLKFANAVIYGRIYVAGGFPTTTAVEMYDPETDSWQVVAQSPGRRYDCVGAAVDGVFYVIGGGSGNLASHGAGGSEAHVYSSSMDMYDVEARTWLRSSAVPGGDYVLAACEAAGHIFVLISNDVEHSFWKFDARRNSPNRANRDRRNQISTAGFGDWNRIRSPPLPPLPTKVWLDSAVRFRCVGMGEEVMLIQVAGCIDDLLRLSGRKASGLKEGLVLIYNTKSEEWSLAPSMPRFMHRVACVSVEC